MAQRFPKCQHCKERSGTRPMRLCFRCYYTPGLKERYRDNRKFGPRPFGRGWNPNAALPAPTSALPGTVEAILVLRERVQKGQALRHPGDSSLENLPPPRFACSLTREQLRDACGDAW